MIMNKTTATFIETQATLTNTIGKGRSPSSSGLLNTPGRSPLSTTMTMTKGRPATAPLGPSTTFSSRDDAPSSPPPAPPSPSAAGGGGGGGGVDAVLQLCDLEPKELIKHWQSVNFKRTSYETDALLEYEKIARKGQSYKQHCARRYYAEGYKMLNALRRRVATAEEAENIGKVARSFTLAVVLLPDMAKAWIARGKTHVLMGKDGRALVDFSMAIELESDNAPLYHDRSWCLRRLSRFDMALDDMLSATELAGSKVSQYYAVLGDLYLKLDKLTCAAAAYEKFISLTKSGGGSAVMLPRSYFNLGLCLWGQMKVDEAIPAFSTACQLDDKNSTYHFLLGEAYLEAGRLDDAERGYSKAIALKATDPTFYYHRGTCRFSVGTRLQVAGAIEDFDHAIDLLGDRVPASLLFERARALLSLRDTSLLDRVIEDVSRASSMDTGNADYHHMAGLAHEMKGQMEAALDCYENALRCNQHHASSKFHAGQIYHRLGHLRNALNCYSSLMVSVKDGDARLYEARGLVYNDMEAYHRAERDFSKALQLLPRKNGSLYYHRGVAHKHLGHFKEAQSDFQQALDLGGGGLVVDDQGQQQACVLIERGIMFKHSKRYEEALKDLDMAVMQDPDNTRTRLYRGLCYLETGQYDMAEKEFIATEDVINRTGHLKKLQWIVRYNIGLVHYRRKEWRQAVHTMATCLQLLPHSPPDEVALPDLCYHMGVALASLNKHADAEKAFADAIRLHLGTVKSLWLARMERAKCLLHLKRFPQAVHELTQVTKLSPHNANAYFLRGWAHKNLQQYKDAAADFSTAQLLEPSNRAFEVNFKGIHDIRWVVLSPPGEEKDYDAITTVNTANTNNTNNATTTTTTAT